MGTLPIYWSVRSSKRKKSLLTSSLLWLVGKAARFHWRGRQFKPRSWPKVGRHWIGRNEITRFCKINRRLLFKPKQSQVQASKKPFQSTSKFMQFEASALSNKMAFFCFITENQSWSLYYRWMSQKSFHSSYLKSQNQNCEIDSGGRGWIFGLLCSFCLYLVLHCLLGAHTQHEYSLLK